MLSTVPVALLALLLSTEAVEAAAPPGPLDCHAPQRLLELEPASTAPLEVCVTPGLGTTLLFGAPIIPASVVLQGEEHFEPPEPVSRSLLLLLRDPLPAGTRLKLEARFADGASPEQVTLLLVVHPAQLVRQVRVVRRVHTVEFYQQREQQARAEAQRYKEALERVENEPQVQGGLRGLIRSGMVVGDRGVAARDISNEVRRSPSSVLRQHKVWVYHSVGRVALNVELYNEGTRACQVTGASLTGPRGEALTLLPLGPQAAIAPRREEAGGVVVEAVAPADEIQGAYRLALWGEDDACTFSLKSIVFP